MQLLENKALSRGIIGKSAPILAEITIRKSQYNFVQFFGETLFFSARQPYISLSTLFSTTLPSPLTPPGGSFIVWQSLFLPVATQRKKIC
jgi:hypothetical protein